MNVRSRNNLIIIIVAFVIFLLTLIDQSSIKKISKSKILMDTSVDITVYGIGKDKEKYNAAIDKAFGEIERIENLMSSYIDGSDISNINNAKGAKSPISSETLDILKTSKFISDITNDAFDITLGRLIDLWGFTSEEPRVPSDDEIKEVLNHVGSENVKLMKTQLKKGDTSLPYYAYLRNTETKIDLGGIAKGYAIKMAAKVLKDEGVKNGIIDAGGDMVIIGDKKGKPYRIGIKSPDGDGLIGIINARDISIVTSGDYERFFIKDGVKYHHILDPKTGYPARECRSVTVIANDATIADALSTALFVMGPTEAIELCNILEGVEAIIIDEKNELHISKGAAEFMEIEKDDESD